VPDSIPDPIRRTLEVPRTARYHVLAGEQAGARSPWFLLHGYAQLARPFLDSARALARPERVLVAPEALSRLYLRRGTGSVGASWMTREERADEIRDTLRYLDLLWQRVRDDEGLDASSGLTALGFSQGGAAAARWAVLGSAPVTHLISWGCQLPQDLDLDAHTERVRRLRWTFVFGDADQAIDRGEWDQGIRRLQAAGVEPEIRRFAGGHALEERLLAEL
jgi:predicted esterase